VACAPPYKVLSFAMSLSSWFMGDGQQVRVARTFLEVVDIVQGSDMGGAVAHRSRTMPLLPSLGLDFEASSKEEKDEPAVGPAVLAQPSSEEHRPDQDQRLTVRVVRTFLEFVSDVTDTDEIANERLKSITMPLLPILKEVEEEASSSEKKDKPAAGPAGGAPERVFGEIGGQRLSEPNLGSAILSHGFAEPVEDAAVPETKDKELESRLMMPHSFWAAPLCPGPVEPVHEDPDQVSLQLHSADLQMRKEHPRQVVPQHADTYSGPFPVRMVEQHNSGRCFPCLFFTRRGDGCRQGDRCTHCHVCRPDEIRRRRNRIAAEVKRANKLARQR